MPSSMWAPRGTPAEEEYRTGGMWQRSRLFGGALPGGVGRAGMWTSERLALLLLRCVSFELQLLRDLGLETLTPPPSSEVYHGQYATQRVCVCDDARI